MRRGEVALVGQTSEPATLLSLFVLAQSGIESQRIKLIRPGDAAGAQAPFAAVDRSAGDAERRSHGRRPMVTTADASMWAPYVAIAPQAFITQHHEATAKWIRAWLSGVSSLKADVPSAARSLAAQNEAPEVIHLLERIGQIEYAGLSTNAQVSGLSGRGAVTLETLFGQYWSILRQVGVITTPAPPNTPLYPQAIAQLVRADPQAVAPQVVASTRDFSTPVLLRHTLTRPLDEALIVRDIGLLSGVFEASAIRVGLRSRRPTSEQIIAETCERYGLSTERFEPSQATPRGAAGVIEILAAP
jgi:hypothetical protein